MGILGRIRTVVGDQLRRLGHVAPLRTSADRRPLILLLADRRGWAFDHAAQALLPVLGDRFRLKIAYVGERPWIETEDYDLIHVFFWGEDWHRRSDIDPLRVVKEVWSNRWRDDPRYGPCTPVGLAHRHLRDAATVTVTSRRMFEDLKDAIPSGLHLTPNGVDPDRFHPVGERSGPMRTGWAGNPADPVKRFALIESACRGFDLRVAGGGLSHEEMNAFYNGIDVFVLASLHEGDPLPLLEAMAAGCYPICTDVGIVRDVVSDETEGRIFDGTIADLRRHLAWCAENLDAVRMRGRANADRIAASRSWSAVGDAWAVAWNGALDAAKVPLLRNDDVGFDTDLPRFERFCALFRSRGLRQIHGITLHGRLATLHRHGGEPSEYPGEAPTARLDNDRIRTLAAGLDFVQRDDLIAALSDGPDEIALHGLYHVDHGRMGYDEQVRDLEAGLATLERCFPRKPVRRFIPPFNRTNRHTRRACRTLGLHCWAEEGIHLEAELTTLRITRGGRYRYHHHRFYPESTFEFYDLDLDRLAAALDRSEDPPR